MRPVLGALAILVLLTGAVGAIILGPMLLTGVNARDEPTIFETWVARCMRHMATPRVYRDRRNPLAATPESLARARAHFADHCASCHGNDGKGQTTVGLNLYPKAPDMTLPGTAGLSDGELFSIIQNGVRLTGMPAWGSPWPENDAVTWELVHFIRHLPRITADELEEMKSMNPKTREELDEDEAIRKFLEGGEPPRERGRHQH
jgi:mono/diheme cytochrome c family protein